MKHTKTVVIVLVCLIVGFVAGTCVSPDSSDSHTDHGAHESSEEIWTCSMHPEIQQPNPGDCPICGMDLVPRGSGPELSDTQVSLSDSAKEFASIQTTRVKRNDGAASFELTGRVSQNVERTRDITAWFSGRVDSLKVASEGSSVRKGEVIAYLYSPEIYAAHQDLLVAHKQLAKLSDADPFARNAIQAGIDAAKTKLRLMGLSERQIERMANAKTASTRVPLRSPFSGTVVKKQINEGAYVKVGQPLLSVADLGSVWVELFAYPEQVASIKVGDLASYTVEGDDAERQAKVSFVEPVVGSSRTTVVRLEVSTADSKLRPGAFVRATIDTTRDSSMISIPYSAVLFGGAVSIVYVEVSRSPLVYEAREVELGARFGDLVEVADGLTAGEKVVTHGAFALDADLQIRGGLSLMNRVPDRKVDMSPQFRTTLSSLIDAYLDLAEALAQDNGEAASAAWQRVADVAIGSDSELDPIREIQKAFKHEIPKEIASMRAKLSEVSGAMIGAVEHYGNPTSSDIRLAHCPMANDNKGGDWLQRAESIRNAYFGDQMLACGSVERTFRATKEEPSSQPESQ